MKGKPDPAPTTEQINAAVMDIVVRRGLNASACPSDVARHLQPDNWRPLMPKVREVAAQLAREGKISVTQRGSVLSPMEVWTGPIRLRLLAPNDKP